jgi:LysM repeat protein
MSARILDYSYARPGGANIASAGYTGVSRYLSYNTDGKNLSPGERDDLRSHGLAIMLNFEAGAQNALGGLNQGVADAHQALNLANGLGYPLGCAIYFSVDFDATPEQQTPINAYFDGIKEVLPLSRIGCYGGFWVVKRVWEAGKASFLWQTLAWSGGQLYPAAHLYQNGETAFSGGADVDEVLGAYGEWPAQGNAPQPPVPAPTPPTQPPTPSAWFLYRVVSGDTLSAIAQKFHTSVNVIAETNHIANVNLIQVGQVLRISKTAPSPQQNHPSKKYTVVSGDTLTKIAAEFHTSVQVIARANNIQNINLIKVGQVLVIP